MERNGDDIVKLRDGKNWLDARGRSVKGLSSCQLAVDWMEI